MRHVIVILLSSSMFASALVEEDSMPAMLQDCYSAQQTEVTTELQTQTNCLKKYLSNLFGKIDILDNKAMDWVETLGKGIHRRIKRQTRRYNTYNRYSGSTRNRNKFNRNTINRNSNGNSNRFDRNSNRFNRNRNRFDRNRNRFDDDTNGFNDDTNGFNRNGNGFNRQGNGFNRNGNGFNRNSNGFDRNNRRGPSQRLNGRNRGGLRLRKEIRAMSDSERQDFFDAVNALKNDRSQTPNQYDAFALLHQNTALESGHDGPNFVGWHRYYLVLFEEALRTKRPNVALPYWDSTLDFNMNDPTESILWTKIFLGNGQGVVYTGPFGNWITPSNNSLLRRDIPGPDSSLIDPERIQNVLNKRYHREILSPTAASDKDNLEIHHDGVHRWVGGSDGHMGGLTTSSQDPVFFLHHCYIDYLWEKFRERQRSLGIDSERDYPTPNTTFHNPNRVMDNLFPPMRNIEGYSDIFTRNIYRYAPEPTCRNRCGGAFRGYLFCNPQTNRCESSSRQRFIEMKGFDQVGRQYINDGAGSGATNRIRTNQASAASTGVSTFNAPMDNTRTSRAPPPYIPGDKKFKVYFVDRRTVSRGKRSIRSFKNENEGLLTKQLVTMPITIINEHKVRSPRLSGSHLKISGAKQIIQNPGTFDINIETLGFSYIGNHTNKIHVDDGSEYSESSSFVLFQKPVRGETTAYVRVNDNYGGICKPQCLKSDVSQQYEDCTGVIKVTQDLPKMYYDIENINTLKDELTQNTFLRFICSN